MGKLFKRGYRESRKEAKRQEERREAMKGHLFRFFLQDDGDEADVRFLTEEPITFWEHNIKKGNRYDSVICTGDDCSICDGGDNPSFKGAFLVFDRRSYKNKDGKKVNGSLKMYVAGTRVITQLDRLHERYGLTNRDYTIVRNGKGTSTTYTFDRQDEDKLTKKEIAAMLPDNLVDRYDGTMESLYAIIENSLEISASLVKSEKDTSKSEEDYDEEIYDDSEEDDEPLDDNDYIDEEDEEDEEVDVKPAKKSFTKKSSVKSVHKRKLSRKGV